MLRRIVPLAAAALALAALSDCSSTKKEDKPKAEDSQKSESSKKSEGSSQAEGSAKKSEKK